MNMLGQRAGRVNNAIYIIMIVREGGMVASEIASMKGDATVVPKSVREYAEVLRPRYLAAKTRREEGVLLWDFCTTTARYWDSAVRTMLANQLHSPLLYLSLRHISICCITSIPYAAAWRVSLYES